MYIQCSTVKRKGKDGRNRKLVEAYRDPKTGKPRNRTVQKLEKLPILERSRIILKYGGQKHLDQEEWKALYNAGDLNRPELQTYLGDSYRGLGNWVLFQNFKSSSLASILTKHLGTNTGAIIRDLITLQILHPDSKLAYVQKRKNLLNYIVDGKQDYKEDSFYLALDKLEEHFDAIRDDLNASYTPSSRLLLYDLSNSYFCGTKAELGGYGHSKEKRHDRYIVTYGLVTQQDSMPLDIKVWKGGTADVNTVANTFLEWKEKYQCSSAIWVADRSMSDEDTWTNIQNMGMSYITGLPAASQISLLENIHENCPELFDETLSEFESKGHRYILCRHQHKGYSREIQNHQNLRKVYEALKKIQASPQNSNKEKLYHRAMKVLEKYKQTQIWKISFDTLLNKKGKTCYRLVFRMDRQQLRAKNVIGHYYLLGTDLAPKHLTAQQAQQYYKNLIKIERCFRTVKSSLEIRPIRHRKEKRIKAHIYLNFLSLWIVKYIERKWKAKDISCEVADKLREWDASMMLHEIIDKDNKKLIELQWNKGPKAESVLKEAQQYGEIGKDLPHL